MGYKRGNVPLVGIPLPYILDGNIFEYPSVYGGSGVKHYTLKISPYALTELNHIIATLN